MNIEQNILTADVQVVPPPPRDYDMEAASQPRLPARSPDQIVSHGGMQDCKPAKPRSCRIFVYTGFVLFAMAATGVAVWFLMDSSIKNTTRVEADSQFQEPTDFTATLPPLPSPATDPPLAISEITPLSICMGDCDEDSDCGPGLKCFQRIQNTPVPGCSGGLEDKSNSDYCIPIEQPPVVVIETTSPLGLCEGDCDSNDDCGNGLVCYQRSEYEHVPGCTGGTADGSRTDYCVPKAMVPQTYMFPMGAKLFGNPDDNFGSSVSLSQSEPLLMAVGAVDRGSTGYVNIYKLGEGDTWTLAGTIPGDEAGSDFGHAVSISWDGKYVAVAMHKGKDGGRVKVFELSTTNRNGMSWNQVGDDVLISNPYNDDGDGDAYTVSLSENGSILAVAQQYYFSTFQRTDSGKWIPLGSALDIGSFGGGSISLSGDGSRVAVNVQPYDVYPYDGYGRVYEFNGADWTRVGQTLGDLSIYDSFGLSNVDLTATSLSGDGTTVVMSCIDRDAENSYVRVYLDRGDSEWVPMGDPILSKLDEHAPASKVEISKDGEVVAVGDYKLGRVRLYEFDRRLQQWILVGEVYAENEDDQLGVKLSLAGGKGAAYLAIGGPHKKHIVGNPGFVATYKTTFGYRPDPTPAPSSAPTEWNTRLNDPSMFSDNQSWYGNDHDSIGVAGNSVAVSGDGRVFAYGLTSETLLNRVVIYEDDPDGGGRDERPQLSGLESEDEFGYSIALSNDGLILAVGIPNSLVGTVEGAGSVKVYMYDRTGETWNQMGGDIVGSLLYESGRFGHSISLNDNGDILAVGAPKADAGVSIFRFENNQWVKMGDDISVPVFKAALHGWSVSLSSNGFVVAVGGPTNEDNWDEAGACRIYEFVNGSWQSRGQPILGEQRHGLLGASVSLSGDGDIVAIGSINYELPEVYINKEEDVYQYGKKAGAVFVYQYSSEGDWKSLGKPIIGVAAFDNFGRSVSLTKDGKKFAAGAPEHGEGGHVRLFVLDEEHLYWDQVEDVQRYDSYADDGKHGGFGTSVALVDGVDGLRMAVGAPRTRSGYGENLGLMPKYDGEVSLYVE